MADYKIAIRYARSLMGLAEENKALDAVQQDMSALAAAIKSSRELGILLKSPVVSPEVKENVLSKLFSANFHKITMTFLALVVRKRREDVIPAMALGFNRLYNLRMGIVEAKLVTASPIEQEIQQQISEMVASETGKKVQLDTQIDPELIAGFVLHVGDQRFEATVARELKELRKLFSDNPHIQKY